jgi:3-methyladenine DNA glycosylase AlkD
MSIQKKLKELEDKEKALILQRFFKTKKGEYGHGDIFLGINVPELKKIAKDYYKIISFNELLELITSKIHEERFISLQILLLKYEKAKSKNDKAQIIKFYLDNLKGVNNWDLVDVSCYKLLGNYILNFNEKKELLYEFAQSDNLWKRRISIISTFEFIRNDKFDDTLKIAKILINDKHDLIHKAVGWMLREIGKRDIICLENFLKEYYKIMQRTMLRYSIEKFNKDKKDFYMK